MPVPSEFLDDIGPLLGWYYGTAAALNWGAAWHDWRRGGRRAATAWLVLGLAFVGFAVAASCGYPLSMPESVKDTIDRMLGPVTLTMGSLAVFVALFLGRRFFVIPAVVWSAMNVSLLFVGASLTDPEFAAIVTRPDNVPIVAMVYLLGFCIWLGAAQAVKNDERIARGQGPSEKDFGDKVLVWPDLVYIELISMVILTTVLTVWSIGLRAPLESPANPAVTPNPSKAPWYFVGLQEMLLYFDPPIAGVLVPCLIILGLAAIPFLDRSPQPSGFYTIRQRQPVYLVFMFGFIQLWILLILIGTFFRGPNWSFFGLYEPRELHKLTAAHNVNLSEIFWVKLLGRAVPDVPLDRAMPVRLMLVCWREIAGLVLLAAYFGLLPWAMGRTILRDLRSRIGRGRYWTLMFLLLMMLALPAKMLLQWTAHLSHIVNMPEYFFGF